jgi:hypothetical protein
VELGWGLGLGWGWDWVWCYRNPTKETKFRGITGLGVGALKNVFFVKTFFSPGRNSSLIFYK